MSALSCGVDIGSTNVKVTLVDEGGQAVWTKAVPTPRLPDHGGVATDALALVAMIEEMIVTGWRLHGRSLPLQAIAAAGVGEDGMRPRRSYTNRTGPSVVRPAGRDPGERSTRNFSVCRAGWVGYRLFPNGSKMALA